MTVESDNKKKKMKLPGQPEEGEPEDHEAPSKGTTACVCSEWVGKGCSLPEVGQALPCRVMPIRGPAKNVEVNPIFQACMLVPQSSLRKGGDLD